ncbi:hypothetical protein [Pontiella sulfatireligans]|uniref:Uncharacterized protein n=1 Tax=Pontiella sulfatireligans TaxID=2750658 RepID=A0A6C2UN91_9BACT|nr:hypothetical protein [Pontiella sulfatireligans]VGO21648.1 hypothetical protein SCARR_03722 [Pontiella sulfatireligans]
MEQIKDILEIIYFISAPIITIIAAIGLWQIKVSKDHTRISAKRDALSLAAQQCDHYLRNIIPLHNSLDKAILANEVTFMKKAKVTFKGESIRIQYDDTEVITEECMKISSEMLPVLNALESFSVFFTAGAADERVAFSCVGKTFCSSVQDLLPEIMLHRDSGYWKHITALFFLWKPRLDEEMLLKEKEQIDKKLKSINGKFITPTGTIKQ